MSIHAIQKEDHRKALAVAIEKLELATAKYQKLADTRDRGIAQKEALQQQLASLAISVNDRIQASAAEDLRDGEVKLHTPKDILKDQEKIGEIQTQLNWSERGLLTIVDEAKEAFSLLARARTGVEEAAKTVQ
jgi:hypothetical protein